MEKYISLLKEQINKLEEKDFDLNAWKTYTLILLDRIFGEKNRKSEAVRAIKHDFGSWSLRDTSGKHGSIDDCKKMGREILEASILELKNFGVPENLKQDESFLLKKLRVLLEDNLKVSEYKQIRSIALSAQKEEEKQREIKDLLEKNDPRLASDILAKLLSLEETASKL